MDRRRTGVDCRRVWSATMGDCGRPSNLDGGVFHRSRKRSVQSGRICSVLFRTPDRRFVSSEKIYSSRARKRFGPTRADGRGGGGVISMMDYETLRLIWWALLGILLIGFAVMDGFDLGLGATFRILGRTDAERRTLLASIEPVWEGNQVWFILGGGAVFAAWPLLYAASFSGLY